MAKKVKRMTRQEYSKRLQEGQQFRGASLYEAQHAPAGTEFYLVELTASLSEYKRRIK